MSARRRRSGGEIGKASLDVAAGLTQDLEIANDRVLSQLALAESSQIHALGIPLNLRDRLQQVREAVVQAPWIAAHTGTA